MPGRFLSRWSQVAVALWCATALCGCATWNGPRIDPTGQSLIVWPGEAPYAAAPPTIVGPTVVSPAPVDGPPVVAPPPGAVIAPPPAVVAPPPVVVPMAQPGPRMVPSTPFGNVVAPPVYSDPTSGPVEQVPLVASVPPPVVAPAPYAPPPALPAAPAGMLALPPPPGTVPGGVMRVANVVPAGCDHLQIMPTTLVAPVGAEMLLKARIFSDGRYLCGRRVNWNIVQGSVGQFTDMGFRDRGQILSFWEAPHRADDWSALSQTALVPITLNTGLDNPCQHIRIEQGEAWVTLTSVCEGTSIISACTPVIDQNNVASAMIYWVDAQWIYPQTVPAEAGRPYTLTTTVMRRSDGAPLPGWIVRFDVGGGAGLGYEGGASTESTTDAAGRASVEVSPRDGGGGATTVCMTIIRPATGGPVPMPRLEVGRASSTITWGAAGIPVVPAPGLPGAPAMPAPSLPSGPAAPGGIIPLPPPPLAGTPPSLPAAPPAASNPPPSPYTPAPPSAPLAQPPAAAGTPRLELTLGPPTPAQVAVGDYVSFDLTVTNRGDGVARNIKIADRFDRGLRHDKANPGVYSVENTLQRELGPSESVKVPLGFWVVDSGLQYHEVTVTADGAAAVSQRGSVTARAITLKVDANVPRQHSVGDVARCSAVVRNAGEAAATNVEFIVRADSALSIRSQEQGHEILQDGRLRLRFDRLEPGEKRTFGIEALCRAPSNAARVVFEASASGGAIAAAEGSIEILAPVTGGPSGAAAGSAEGLKLSVSTVTNPARVGQNMIVTVEVENAGQQVERDVMARVRLIPELTPDASKILPQGEGSVTPTDVRLGPIAEIAPGQRKQYLITYTPNRTGRVQLIADVATGNTNRKTVTSDPIDILGASQ